MSRKSPGRNLRKFNTNFPPDPGVENEFRNPTYADQRVD